MEICGFCDGEGFIMSGIQIIHCEFCKGSGVIEDEEERGE